MDDPFDFFGGDAGDLFSPAPAPRRSSRHRRDYVDKSMNFMGNMLGMTLAAGTIVAVVPPMMSLFSQNQNQ